MTFSGKTRLYGLIGNPVSHSLSPAIMNHAFALYGIDAAYLAFEVERSAPAAALGGLWALGASGANVTYPYKEAILAFVDDLSPGVLAIQAANTLIFKKDEILAFNTDAVGVKTALETWGRSSLKGKKVFIFGAGGAGRAAAYGLLEAGVREVNFCMRDPAKGAGLVRRFEALFPGSRISLTRFSGVSENKEIGSAVRKSDIVINATPVGMEGNDSKSLPVEATWFDPEVTCFDFVYQPRDTEFLESARAGGAGTLGGLELLVAQAREAFRLWTGESFSLQEMLDYVQAFPAGDSCERGAQGASPEDRVHDH
jgi:shikimate dehydrogenase